MRKYNTFKTVLLLTKNKDFYLMIFHLKFLIHMDKFFESTGGGIHIKRFKNSLPAGVS